MRIDMRNIEKYICQTCGGKIVINETKRICSCESCGNDFDYEYFFDKDLLAKAKDSLSKREFTTANKMFDFYLMDNPDSREAFVGKVMSSSRVSSIEEMNYNTMSKSLITADYSNYKNVTGEDSEIINVCRESVDLARTIASNANKMAAITSANDKRQGKIKALNDAIPETYIIDKKGRSSEVRSFIRFNVIESIVMSVVATIILVVATYEEFTMTDLGLLIAALLVINAVYFLVIAANGAIPKYKQLKKIEADIAAIHDEIGAAHKESNELTNESKNARDVLTANIGKIRKWAMM